MAKTINNENYHEETFEPLDEETVDNPGEDFEDLDDGSTEDDGFSVEDTDERGTLEDEGSTGSEAGADDTPPPDPQDNRQVRYEYWQSEAARAQQREAAAQQRIADLEARLAKPAEEEEQPPQEPDSDDPMDLVKYNTELTKYLLRQDKKRQEAQAEEKRKAAEAEQRRAQQDYVLGKITEITKSPEKSQKIMTFFANAQNLKDPALFNVMYDAAQSYLNGNPPTKPAGADSRKPGPPPPVDGGETERHKPKSPDDAFNDSLGEEDRYRL